MAQGAGTPGRSPLLGAVREAAVAALVALVLAVPLLGFETVQMQAGLELHTRWPAGGRTSSTTTTSPGGRGLSPRCEPRRTSTQGSDREDATVRLFRRR